MNELYCHKCLVAMSYEEDGLTAWWGCESCGCIVADDEHSIQADHEGQPSIVRGKNMRMELVCENDEKDGVPNGGTIEGVGLSVRFQKGALAKDGVLQEPNGAFVEGLIQGALQRIQYYETACDGRFSCLENREAIRRLEQALVWLDDRTANRVARGVEGTHQA